MGKLYIAFEECYDKWIRYRMFQGRLELKVVPKHHAFAHSLERPRAVTRMCVQRPNRGITLMYKENAYDFPEFAKHVTCDVLAVLGLVPHWANCQPKRFPP